MKLRDTLKYRLERFVLSGTPGRLALMGGLVALLSVLAGLAAMWADPTLKKPGEAIWWAFLRLTDPGYLGDDKGGAKRFISTMLTILGLAVFVGGLVAIVAQWLNETVRRLERGLTPVSLEDHVVILGWTDRTIGIVRELVRSQERARRFLQLRHRRHLELVVLARELDAAKLHEFKTLLGEDWDDRLVTLRSGTPLRNEHLARVDFLRAAAIVLPGADFGQGAEAVDTRTVKTILAIDHAAREVERAELPVLIAELYDSRKIAVARRAYRGHIELLASDRVTGSLMAQNTRHRNLSHIYRELLDQEGNELYVRTLPELAGQRFHALPSLFPWAVPIGVVRSGDRPGRWRDQLCPPLDYRLAEDDYLVFICEAFSHCEPLTAEPEVDAPLEPLVYTEREPPTRRVLVLGWSHMLAALLEGFDGFERQRHEVHVLSTVEMGVRARQMRGYDLNLENVTVHHHAGDYTLLSDLRRVQPASFDHIILLASDWVGSAEESDARTIVGFLLLGELLGALPEGAHRPEILVELTDESNQELIDGMGAEILVSAVLEGHMLAQITLRRELRVVFDALFGSSMPMFDLRPVRTYEGLVGRELTFGQLQTEGRRWGEIVIGVRQRVAAGVPGAGVVLNPDRSSSWRLTGGDDLVVLVRSWPAMPHSPAPVVGRGGDGAAASQQE